MFQVAWLFFIITLFLAFETVLMQGYNNLLFGKFEENFLIFFRGGHQNQNKYATQLLFKRISRNYKQKSGPGTNNNVELKWEYFNALTFLHDTIKARKIHSTLVVVYANLSCHGTFPDILK